MIDEIALRKGFFMRIHRSMNLHEMTRDSLRASHKIIPQVGKNGSEKVN